MTGSIPQVRRRYDRWITNTAPPRVLLARVGLGVVIGLAGVHTLIARAVWTAAAQPIAALWPTTVVSFDLVMIANGVIEALVGLALLADLATSVLAGIVVLSLLGVVVTLRIAGVTTASHVDVLIRDVGLVTLAVCV